MIVINVCILKNLTVLVLFFVYMLMIFLFLAVICLLLMILRNFLSNNFEMKDLGPANAILGIKIIKSDKGIVLSQEHYVDQLLKKFNYCDAKVLSTPLILIFA